MGTIEVELIPIEMGFVTACLVRGEGVVLVDTGLAGQADRILARAAKQGIRPEEIKLIAITHVHGDHAGSAAELVRRTGASLAVQASEAPLLAEGTGAPIEPRGRLGRFFVRLIPPSKIEPVEPDVVVGERLDLQPYGVSGFLMHTPGHTPGSLSLVIPGKFAFIGDLLMGFGPWMGAPMLATDPNRVFESTRAVLKEEPKDIWLAHGGRYSAEAVAKALK
jgi:glyoxylase-like metal-dependent hydrolase (beta-lactamase superfamily II)